MDTTFHVALLDLAITSVRDRMQLETLSDEMHAASAVLISAMLAEVAEQLRELRAAVQGA